MKIIQFIIVAIIFVIDTTHSVSYTTYSVDNYCNSGFNDSANFNIGETSSYNSGSAITVKATSGYSYKESMNCTIRIKPPPSHGVIFIFQNVDLYGSYSLCPDYITFKKPYSASNVKICRYNKNSYVEQPYYFDGGVSFLFHSEPGNFMERFGKRGFELLVTSFTSLPCLGSEFRCFNRRCINRSLRCDGHDNCGDNSDELRSECDTRDITPEYRRYDSTLGAFEIVIICVCIAIALGVIVAVVSCLRKRSNTVSGVVVSQAPRSRTLHPYESDRPPAYSVAVSANMVYPPVNQPVGANDPAVDQVATIMNTIYPSTNVSTGISNPSYTMQEGRTADALPISQGPPKY